MQMPSQHPRKGAQVRHRTSETIVHILLRNQPICRFAQAFAGCPQGIRHLGKGFARSFCCCLDLIQQGTRRLAPIHHLARHKVHRLNAIGALIDRSNPHITVELSGPGFLNKAHAAMHLHAHFSHSHSSIRTKGFGNWRQESGPRFPFGRICGRAHINRMGAGQRDGPRGKDISLHRN